MRAIHSGRSEAAATLPWWQGRTAKRAFLSAGLITGGVYVVGDIVSGLLYDKYSFLNQAISELTAFGSPVRPEMQAVMLVHGTLVMVFGAGIFLVADRASTRWVGGLLVAAGAVGFPTHTVWAMSSRGMESGFNDTMHITMSLVFSLLVAAAMILAGITYRGWFRRYSFLTLAVVMGFGMASAVQMGGVKQNNTPWTGAFERINAYSYFVWLAVLAVLLMRRRLGPALETSRRDQIVTKPPLAA